MGTSIKVRTKTMIVAKNLIENCDHAFTELKYKLPLVRNAGIQNLEAVRRIAHCNGIAADVFTPFLNWYAEERPMLETTLVANTRPRGPELRRGFEDPPRRSETSNPPRRSGIIW